MYNRERKFSIYKKTLDKNLFTWGGCEARVCGTGGRHFHVTPATASSSARESCSRALSVTSRPVGVVNYFGHTH